MQRQNPRRFRIDEIAEIISIHKRHKMVENRGIRESCALIGEQFGRSTDVIYALIRRFQPSVDGAEAYLKAQSLKLAMRVVRKANVEQAINILERSNVGVLAPKQDAGGGGGGFFLSVQAENLGAVRIGVASVQPAMMISPSTPYAGASGLPDDEDTTERRARSALSGVQEGTGDDGVAGDCAVSADSTGNGVGEPAPQSNPPLYLPGVPHETQGTVSRFARPIEEWSASHRATIEAHRRKLTAARKDARLRRNRKVEV